tara:strand:+ start:198 stop:605 length:408 start_codon:yes stop_codon:yes gene_type:complete
MEPEFPNMDVYLVSNECHAFALRLILPEQTANFFYPLEHWDRSVFYNIDLTSFPGFAFVMLSRQLSFGGNGEIPDMNNAIRYIINRKRKTIKIEHRINGTIYQVINHQGNTIDGSVTFKDHVITKAKNILKELGY